MCIWCVLVVFLFGFGLVMKSDIYTSTCERDKTRRIQTYYFDVHSLIPCYWQASMKPKQLGELSKFHNTKTIQSAYREESRAAKNHTETEQCFNQLFIYLYGINASNGNQLPENVDETIDSEKPIDQMTNILAKRTLFSGGKSAVKITEAEKNEWIFFRF